jgi:hypothetical protein
MKKMLKLIKKKKKKMMIPPVMLKTLKMINAFQPLTTHRALTANKMIKERKTNPPSNY